MMATEKQRQRRRDNVKLTESGNARSEQLNTRGAYRVANQQRWACLSGSERRRPGWFLDTKYQTCYGSTEIFASNSEKSGGGHGGQVAASAIDGRGHRGHMTNLLFLKQENCMSLKAGHDNRVSYAFHRF